MLNHKELFVRAARRNVFSSRFVLRNDSKKALCRYLSSARPLFEEEEDAPSETWMRKQVAQQEATKGLGSRSHAVDYDASNDTESSHITNDTSSSPSELTYTGNATMPITTHLHIVTPEEDTPRGVWPVFRLMVSFESYENCRQ
jgi:hypothetical protein